MIASMTSFGRTEKTEEIGQIIWEIRSVNHRYLEISTRLPENLRMLEATIREYISNRIKRGKIDCTLKFEPNRSGSDTLSINMELVSALARSCDSVQTSLKDASPVNPLDLLRWPGVINSETPDPEKIGGPLLQQLDATLDLAIETRLREGEKLRAIILDRCTSASGIIAQLREKLPGIMSAQQDRLLTRAQELSIELDRERLEQELLILTQKFDVEEELDRLETHIEEVKRVLDSSEPVGRRLDFLMQELNREANTLGSKSVHVDETNVSVDLKVLIEQMREQVQNIE